MCATQARPALCRYLVHMVQLDAAAMNLKRRFEDPNITASLEAQQAYTRALAPGGDCCPPHCTISTVLLHPASFCRLQACEMCGALLGTRHSCHGSALPGLSGALSRLRQGRHACSASADGSLMATRAVPDRMSCLQRCLSV